MAHSNDLFGIGPDPVCRGVDCLGRQQTENGVVFYDGIDAEVIITNGKILAKHVSRGKRARDSIVVFYSISYGRSAVKRIYVCEQWDISLTCRRNK